MCVVEQNSPPTQKSSLHIFTPYTRTFSKSVCQTDFRCNMRQINYLVLLILACLAINSGSSPAPFPNSELTDEVEKLLEFGFPLDYSFNETREEGEEKFISAPGCPASSGMSGRVAHPQNRHAWVHYGDPPRCFFIGTRGPCPLEMRLASKRNSTFGVCKCSCYFNIDTKTFNYSSGVYGEIFDPYLDNTPPYCYDGEEHFTFVRDKCYSLLSRGPCKSGKVLLWNSTKNQPNCIPRECPARRREDSGLKKSGFQFLVNKLCKRVGDLCKLDAETSLKTHTDIGKYSIDINSTFPSCRVYYRYGSFSGPAFIEPQPKKCGDSNQKFSKTLQTCIPVSRLQIKQVG